MTIQHWKRKPRPADRIDAGLVTAKYDPSLSGQEYRAMMGDLGTVAGLGTVGMDPQMAEALFEDAAGVRSQVLLVRYWRYDEDGPGEWDYVVVHPGNYLSGHPYDDYLGETDDRDLAQFYEEAPDAAR